MSQTLAAPANGGLVRFGSSCLPADLGGEAESENKRKTAPWLFYFNNAMLGGFGTEARKRLWPRWKGEGEAEEGLEKQRESIFLGRVQTNSAWTIGI